MWRPLLSLKLAEKAYKENRRITQKEVSERTGIRQPTISQWMQSDTRLSRIEADMVSRLADFFNCDPRELFEYADDASRNA